MNELEKLNSLLEIIAGNVVETHVPAVAEYINQLDPLDVGHELRLGPGPGFAWGFLHQPKCQPVDHYEFTSDPESDILPCVMLNLRKGESEASRKTSSSKATHDLFKIPEPPQHVEAHGYQPFKFFSPDSNEIPDVTRITDQMLFGPDSAQEPGRPIPITVEEVKRVSQGLEPESDLNETDDDDKAERQLLEYGILMNMFAGNWGQEEEALLMQFFHKFLHDRAWRKRLRDGCFSLVQECGCEKHPQPSGLEISNLPNKNFFEIETPNEFHDIVTKIKTEHLKQYNYKINLDFEEFMRQTEDSDEDEWLTVENLKETDADTEAQDNWLLKKEGKLQPQPPPIKKRDEEDTLETCGGVEVLTYTNIIPPQERKDIQKATIDLYQKCLSQIRRDRARNLKWNPECYYWYKYPKYY